MSTSTSHSRPLVLYPSRMDRQPMGKHESSDQDAARSATAHNPSHQTLPPFRELLPPHLHEAIDSATHPSASRHEQGRSGSIPSFSEGFDEYASRYRTSPPPLNPQSRRPSLNTVLSYGPGSDGNHQYRNPSFSSQQTSPSLPPFREIQSLSERALTDDRQFSNSTSQYPNSYTHGPGGMSDPDRYGPGQVASYGQGVGPSPAAGHARYGPGSQDMDSRAAGYPGQYADMEYAQQLGNGPHASSIGAMGGDSMDARNKRRRGNLPKPVTDILRTWFHEHLDHPYPSEEDKQIFIARTGLTISQISNWFINARRRQLPALRNQVRAQDHERMSYDQSMADLDSTDAPDSSTSPRSR